MIFIHNLRTPSEAGFITGQMRQILNLKASCRQLAFVQVVDVVAGPFGRSCVPMLSHDTRPCGGDDTNSSMTGIVAPWVLKYFNIHAEPWCGRSVVLARVCSTQLRWLARYAHHHYHKPGWG